MGRPSPNDDWLHCLEEKIKEQERHWIKKKRQLKACEDELKALQKKRDVEARQWDEEAKAAQLKMHQELMQLITASMSTKKDSALAPVVCSSSIIELASMATVAPDIAPSTEVEPHADLHMCKVSESPPRPPLRPPAALPRLPSQS